MARKANDKTRAIRQSLAEKDLEVTVVRNPDGVRGFQSDMTKRLPVFNRKTADPIDRYWHTLSKLVAAGRSLKGLRHPDPRRFKMY